MPGSISTSRATCADWLCLRPVSSQLVCG